MAVANKPKRGRPSQGNSELVWGRVSVDFSAWIDARAEELGIPKARVVGAMLKFAFEHEDQVIYPQSSARHSDQTELPLKRQAS